MSFSSSSVSHAARKSCRAEDEASVTLPGGPVREACGRPMHQRRRKRAAYLGRVCVSADGSDITRRATGTGNGRIFIPRGRKRTGSVRLRHPVRDALKPYTMQSA
jgi:CMP-2-keto-3-deoxyoctulosonic acid synthetase